MLVIDELILLHAYLWEGATITIGLQDLGERSCILLPQKFFGYFSPAFVLLKCPKEPQGAIGVELWGSMATDKAREKSALLVS